MSDNGFIQRLKTATLRNSKTIESVPAGRRSAWLLTARVLTPFFLISAWGSLALMLLEPDTLTSASFWMWVLLVAWLSLQTTGGALAFGAYGDSGRVRSFGRGLYFASYLLLLLLLPFISAFSSMKVAALAGGGPLQWTIIGGAVGVAAAVSIVYFTLRQNGKDTSDGS